MTDVTQELDIYTAAYGADIDVTGYVSIGARVPVIWHYDLDGDCARGGADIEVILEWELACDGFRGVDDTDPPQCLHGFWIRRFGWV